MCGEAHGEGSAPWVQGGCLGLWLAARAAGSERLSDTLQASEARRRRVLAEDSHFTGAGGAEQAVAVAAGGGGERGPQGGLNPQAREKRMVLTPGVIQVRKTSRG